MNLRDLEQMYAVEVDHFETAIAASVGLPFGLSLACIAARR